MPSSTFYISVWFGIIITGFLLYSQEWMSTIDMFAEYFENPQVSIFEFLKSAFDWRGMAFYIAGIMSFGIAAGISNVFSGSGFSLLYIFPALLIFAVVTLLAIPMNTYFVMVSAMPFEIKIIYSLFMGFLTFMTVLSFIGGRS